MCGIIGWVAADPKSYAKGAHPRMQVLQQGLFVDTLRGDGGTGVAAVSAQNDILVYKRALAGPDYLRSAVFEIGRKRIEDAKIAIGHNRAATHGSIKDTNCHPFHFKGKSEIVLVHNGTLNGGYSSLTPATFHHEVDSAHIAYAMAEVENELEVLKKLKGAFVLVWYNKTKNTFNIARNSMRDFSFIRAKNGDFFYASEYMMLDWLLDRNDVDIKDKSYTTPAVDHWYEWPVVATEGLKKPVVRKITYEQEDRFRGGSYYDTTERDSRQNGGYYHGAEIYPRWRDDALGALGFEYNEQIYVEVDAWEPYTRDASNQNPYGRCFGEIIWGANKIKSDISVEVSSVTKAEWEGLKIHRNFLPVRITGYRKGNPTSSDTCLLAKVDLKEINSWGAGNGGAANSPEHKKFVPGPSGVLIAHSEWKAHVKDGCAFCSSPIEDRDYNKILWAPIPTTAGNVVSPLCHSCSVDAAAISTLIELGAPSTLKPITQANG